MPKGFGDPIYIYSILNCFKNINKNNKYRNRYDTEYVNVTMNTNIIGLSGVAGSGKDLFFEVMLKKIPNLEKLSLASALKGELREELLKDYSIDINDCTRKEKNKVRQRLVDYGTEKRIESSGRHWIEKLNSLVEKAEGPVCITDIRYDDYEFDEVHWLKKELGGVLVHIKRYDFLNNNKKFIEGANEEERRNDPKLNASADYCLEWPSFDSSVEEYAEGHVHSFLEWVNHYNEAFKRQPTDMESKSQGL